MARRIHHGIQMEYDKMVKDNLNVKFYKAKFDAVVVGDKVRLIKLKKTLHKTIYEFVDVTGKVIQKNDWYFTIKSSGTGVKWSLAWYDLIEGVMCLEVIV